MPAGPFSPRHIVRPLLLALGAVLACYALALVPREVHPLELTFNSMLDHLLHGRFDVDPRIVGREGFTINGQVMAYWGILPALLRLPMTLFPGWRMLDFTIGSCLVALAGMVATKLWTIRLIRRELPALPDWLYRATLVVLLLSGAQTCFLRFSLYQEVCLWAALWGALFVAAAIHAQLRGLGRGALLVMALVAGLAMLTRVSLGIGLVAAFGGVLLVEMVRSRADLRNGLAAAGLPVLLLVLFGLITAGVNIGRWGDPFTFADYHYYNYNAWYPDRMVRMAEQGLFNLHRVPFGLVYYFAPIWVLQGADGQLLLDATRAKWIDAAELPPSSFLLTDPLLLALGALAILGWMRHANADRARGVAVALGLSIPAGLMLCAVSMNFRYRLDFYPLFEFLAFSGLILAGRGGPAPGPRCTAVLATVSVLFSLLVGAAYLVGRLGPGQLLIGDGVGAYYLQAFGLR
ncbi:hypothetical protein [Sphingomonas sp.]|uniref:hypothetical protein n=1 Tax=Sphingomonas sp. TaxID=28214 RepID=UPI0028AAB712|nr:hypothetical protein [Sphingomonas sp.]